MIEISKTKYKQMIKKSPLDKRGENALITLADWGGFADSTNLRLDMKRSRKNWKNAKCYRNRS